MEDKNNFKKTLIVLVLVLAIAISVSIYIQLTAQSNLSNCSYLDPITVDIFAFLGALFLIIEGLYSIYINKNVILKKQLTRIIRVCFGFTIFTLHIIQLFHKV